MDSFVKADLFFFITALAVIVGTLCLALITYYCVKVLRDVKEITEEARKEVHRVVADVGELREDLKDEGGKLLGQAMVLRKFITKKVIHRKKK